MGHLLIVTWFISFFLMLSYTVKVFFRSRLDGYAVAVKVLVLALAIGLINVHVTLVDSWLPTTYWGLILVNVINIVTFAALYPSAGKEDSNGSV